MSRPLLASVTCIALGALSCQVVAPAAPLPAVSAAPPRVEAPVLVEDRAAEDEVLAWLKSYLGQKRRTGLAEHEIRALARTIVEQAHGQGVDVGLVLAVIHVESRFNNFAVSPVGAMGLMQILPTTGEELAASEGVRWNGSHTLFDPHVNVQLGITYLRQLSDRFGSVPVALAAYNWGPGHIDRRIRRGRPMPTEYPGLVLEALATSTGS